jgi:hypothetical protein
MTAAVYQVYALQYAHRETIYPEVFYRDHRDLAIGMDYFVWAITDGTRTVVVDLGFTEPVSTRRGRQFLRSPAQGLAEIGIDAAHVEHVIITHFHYDHTGNHALFPRAIFDVQDAEMRFYTGRHARHPSFAASIGLVPVPVHEFRGRLAAGRQALRTRFTRLLVNVANRDHGPHPSLGRDAEGLLDDVRAFTLQRAHVGAEPVRLGGQQ